MRFPVTQVLLSPGWVVPMDVSQEISAQLHPQQVGQTYFAQITGQMVSPGDRLLKVQGNIRAKITVQCARCLSPFELEIEAAFDEVFSPVEDPDEPERFIYQGNMLDITHMVTELLAVVLPVAPICKEDCAGIVQT